MLMDTRRNFLAGLLTGALILSSRMDSLGAGYVAHEWGTFTSVQGSDGALIAWNPFTAAELPPFVHERNRTLMPGTQPL